MDSKEIFTFASNINAMMLIAESGSTKTDWRSVSDDGTILQFITAGFNPFHQKSEAIAAEIKTNLLPRLSGEISEVHYYGAGCSSEKMCNVVRAALNDCFPSAKNFVEHDMLAAARGLCGHEKGIACILGTGSNSCVFDGKEITGYITNLGYILGDEGSGAYMGKRFLADFLIGDMPEKLANQFARQSGYDKEKILDGVYRQPMPSRFLATPGKFIFQNINEPYILNLVRKSFTDFFERNICKYPEHNTLPVHFTGSIAFYFSKVLHDVAAEKRVRIGRIIESPAAALVLYHTGKD